jgi:predicted permease
LTEILEVLTQNIFPIFIVALFGYLLQRWKQLDKRVLSTAVLNIFSPCLVFSSLVSSQLPGGELVDIAVFTVLTVLATGGISWSVGKLLRLPRPQRVALMLLVMFVNGGNYGITLNTLRYGDDGLARAVVYYTTSTVLIYSLGLVIASTGHMSWRQSARRLLGFPAFYAAILAVVVYRWSIPIPAPVLRGIEVTGQGAIPVMLLLLGMQMADLRGRPLLRLTIPAVGLRLVVGPLIALTVATLLGLTGLSRSVSIIEASMPPAVFNIILATEFDLEPTAVTSIVVIATLISPLTIATVITVLGL